MAKSDQQTVKGEWKMFSRYFFFLSIPNVIQMACKLAHTKWMVVVPFKMTTKWTRIAVSSFGVTINFFRFSECSMHAYNHNEVIYSVTKWFYVYVLSISSNLRYKSKLLWCQFTRGFIHAIRYQMDGHLIGCVCVILYNYRFDCAIDVWS